MVAVVLVEVTVGIKMLCCCTVLAVNFANCNNKADKRVHQQTDIEPWHRTRSVRWEYAQMSKVGRKPK